MGVLASYNTEQDALKRYAKNTSSSSRDCNVLAKFLCFANEIAVLDQTSA